MELLSGITLGCRYLGLAGALVVGCAGDVASAPTTLVDGSPARPPPVALEGVGGPSVQGLVRVSPGDANELRSTTASCIASVGEDVDGIVVERVGVSGSSVTFFGPERRDVHACDAGDGAWCGHAFAHVRGGGLRDPRLSLSCRAANGRQVGFAWVQPSTAARYVVVEQPGYVEVYPSARGLPVRITTETVDALASSATFTISEHAGDGRRLHTYELEAQVAG
jgi:hypothetical protein